MKTKSYIYRTLFILLTCFIPLTLCAKQSKSPIKDQSMSLWSEYNQVDFQDLSQEEKTDKLEKIFRNKLHFIKTNGIRRLIVKILNPLDFDFFKPDRFDAETSDNFYFWACQISPHAQIEAVFDCSSFQNAKQSFIDRLAGYYDRLRDSLGKPEEFFGNFQDIFEKMEWVSQVNELWGIQKTHNPLISGITLDPTGLGNRELYYQRLINAFDQYRFQMLCDHDIPEWIPSNSFFTIRIGMLLPMDMKIVALTNASTFPLLSEIRTKGNKLGIRLPAEFPSSPPHYSPPSWRSSISHTPLLDTVYLKMNDPRIVSCIYQDYNRLPSPDIPANTQKISALCTNMQNLFTGNPFLKGPGVISNATTSQVVKGNYTFFHTGGPDGEGQFISGQFIEVRPPYLDKPTRRKVSKQPENNRQMQLSSPFSSTKSLNNVEYWMTPIPCTWNYPRISDRLRSRIYFVFSTAHDDAGNQYFGNWNFDNFMRFIFNSDQANAGFVYRQLFTNLNGQLVAPHNNIVLHDFSTIPNGELFTEVNWNLGNETH